MPCGLPTSATTWTSSTTQTTYSLAADCTFSTSSERFLRINSGEFTINGNGYSIIGPSGSRAFQIFGGTLNLNNITIRGAGSSDREAIQSAGSSSRLNATNVTFRNNSGAAALLVGSSGRADLSNIRFLNNNGLSSSEGSAISIYGAATVNLENGIFTDNSGGNGVIWVTNSTLNITGCLIFSGNTGTSIVQDTTNPPAVTDNSSQAACLALTPTSLPRTSKKKEISPTPTSTPRPQIAATHVALQAATGATFRTAFGLDSGVHFRQLDGAGIGIQSIIDAGYLEAFDVYGYVEQGVEVCFPQIGRVIFLDARTMPRAIAALESTIVNGQTCVSINSPGSLVLLPN